MHPLNWTEVEQWAFEELKKALISAPALALPDVMKPFHLYVSEKRPVAYLSKRLDPVAAGWPAYLRAVATTASLVKKADKPTLGQELALTTPHGMEALLRVRFQKTLAINPTSLLPDDDLEEPIHDCTEVTDAVQTARPDLTDALLSSPDEVLFIDGSSYVQDGIRYAGAAGNSPGEHLEVDFTEIKPPASEYKYLLVLIDTFSAYPTRTETASIVVKRLLQEIIPRFELPVVIGSDNSPTFVAKKPVKTGPTSCPSPSYGPCVPSTGRGSSLLFEVMYSRSPPPPILSRVREKLKAGIHNHSLAQALQYTQRATHKLVCDALPVPTADPVHPFKPRDSVWGHYTVILSTPTAVEVDGVQTWLHHSQLLHQETAWILETTCEIPSLGSTQARRRLDTCRRGPGLHCGQCCWGLWY
ncbi:hypothetical protein QTO34_014195 [Cnephaeus nilssonii]|uniref:Integrase catalytic domain-containing protein n=1 Tax=Cnephaeus nilssonii TaxID=3371016 RepID=A0AA40LBP7_CNENI|nr:hypothetical protein QTO34_014195 [Eptesicus nilssonii]